MLILVAREVHKVKDVQVSVLFQNDTVETCVELVVLQ
jgi:hypothetical protein